MKSDLLPYCSHATEREDFVGVRFDFDNALNHHRPYIIFPYGYDYTSNEDVLCLISVLSDYQREMQNIGVAYLTEDEKHGFPIQSYRFVIQDYLSNGYYTERETIYASRANGKVNWGRTVKKEKPVIQDNGAIYLNLQTRLHHNNDEHIMTEISKHCVYESFAKLGWYYGLSTPAKPTSTLRKTQFIAILRDKLHKANKDMDKQLFQSMINVIQNLDENNSNPQYFAFGTRRFEKVWENLIEKTFGTEKGDNKAKYFPKATWHLIDGVVRETNPLLPDTIMINHDDNSLYVIDAKYYRYGITKVDSHLPNMSSIAKQITYAQYIDRHFNFDSVRNVFILPFNAKDNKMSVYHYSGWAIADWIEDTYEYKNIYTILVDTKYLMKNKNSNNIINIGILSNFIEVLVKTKNIGSSIS
nr:LlaJI family restriction endonuclease [Moraxella osloensis]